jgi:hypothetical protein
MHNRDDSSPFSVQHIAYREGSSLIDDASGVHPVLKYSRIRGSPEAGDTISRQDLVMYLSLIQIAS